MSADRLVVALDATAVPLGEPGGAGRYTLELARALVARNDVDLNIVTRFSDGARWRALAAPSTDVLAIAPTARVTRLVFEELALGAALRRAKRPPRVIHAPHYNAPRHPGVPLVVTVHDLTMVEHPQWHERAKVLVFGRALSIAAERARVVICPSLGTAQAFTERYRPKALVVAIAHGIDHGRFAASESVPGGDAMVRDRLGLTTPYIVHLGTIEPRKNVAALIRAFDRLVEQHCDLRLVLAGQLAWGKEEFSSALSDAKHRDRIDVLGYVADDDVPAILRGASVVAYPSKEEGFGLPALEALACGSALVTSKDSAMAEFSAGVATLVDVSDDEALADGLLQALAQDDEAHRMARVARAASYTWERSAEDHVKAYRQALGNL